MGDDLAEQVYIEDEFFMLEHLRANFRAPEPSRYEYFYYHGLQANTSQEAINLFIRQLSNQNQAIVRIPLEMSQTELSNIAQSVINHFFGRLYWLEFNGTMHINLIR